MSRRLTFARVYMRAHTRANPMSRLPTTPAAASGGRTFPRPPSLVDYTPAEVALLFADRFVPAKAEPFLGCYRVPLSGAYVRDDAAAALVMEVALGALFATQDVRPAERQRRGLLLSSTEAYVQLSDTATEQRPGSPEGVLVAWLAAQEGRGAWLDDALRQLMPSVTSSPEHVCCDQSLARLEREGVVVPITRRVMFVIKAREYDVVDRARRQLVAVPERDVRELVESCRDVAGLHRGAVDRAWRHALAARTATDGGASL